MEKITEIKIITWLILFIHIKCMYIIMNFDQILGIMVNSSTNISIVKIQLQYVALRTSNHIFSTCINAALILFRNNFYYIGRFVYFIHLKKKKLQHFNEINDPKVKYKQIKMFSWFLIILFFFSLIIFLNKQIRKTFHKNN